MRLSLTHRERCRGDLFRFGVICLFVTGVMSLGALAEGDPAGKGSAASDDKAVPSVSESGAAKQAKKTDLSDVALAKSELDEMKDEFATLMKRRAGLSEQSREGMQRINAAKSMLTRNPQANTETAKQYREALAKVEKALDEHPEIKGLQDEYDAVQTQKVEVSAQKSEVLTTWRKDRIKKMASLKASVDQANKKAEEARAALLKQAGVKEWKELSESDQARFAEIEKEWKKEVEAAKASHGDLQPQEKEAREKDGSMARFAELSQKYKDMESKQVDIKTRMVKLRGSLRKTDPAIVALEKAALEASQAHMVAVDASPEVAAARKFIDGADRMRSDIDKRARVLRKAILEKDPEYRATLDSQAVSGGLSQVGEDFWKTEG